MQNQKSGQAKEIGDGESEEVRSESGPKVPPLKIVIPGGAGGSGGRNEQEEGKHVNITMYYHRQHHL